MSVFFIKSVSCQSYIWCVMQTQYKIYQISHTRFIILLKNHQNLIILDLECHFLCFIEFLNYENQSISLLIYNKNHRNITQILITK